MINLNFENSFQTLPNILYEKVDPTPIKNPKLMALSSSCLALLGLPKDINKDELVAWLNGTIQLKGEQRISTRYAGHQFGQWAGQLGDGRAISLGEVINSKGERWEVQTKGSGLTPFSRMGDGKAVIRSSVREFLCSEAMQALGIPTTRALALMNGEDEVYRESVERSALVTRVFPTNLRFGHFEYCFHFKKEKELKELIQYTKNTFFSEFPSVVGMLEEIVLRTADLIAQWQGVGFNHGVMNSDNMSILGLTIDYGPFGFMEDTQINHVCNHSDHAGRYSYFRQPTIGIWNLERLLVCFIEEVEKEKLEKILGLYATRFQNSWLKVFREKLGLVSADPGDEDLIASLTKVMHDLQWDFTYFFRSFSYYRPGNLHAMNDFWKTYSANEEFTSFLKLYDARVLAEGVDPLVRQLNMLRVNPKYILRNYIAQEIIEQVERDDNSKLLQWMDILNSPYDEHPEVHEYSLPTPMDRKNIEVSCSS